MTPQEWFTSALTSRAAGPLGLVVRAQGLAATVAGLLSLAELDSRLRVELEARSWGTLVVVSVFRYGTQELRVQMEWNALMSRVAEVEV